MIFFNNNPESNASVQVTQHYWRFVHSEEDLQKAQDISRILFGKATTDELGSMSIAEITDAFDGLPIFEVAKEKFAEGINLVEFLATETEICSSKGDARRNLKGNAISINKEKESDENTLITEANLINNSFVLVQNGKKNHYLVLAK